MTQMNWELVRVPLGMPKIVVNQDCTHSEMQNLAILLKHGNSLGWWVILKWEMNLWIHLVPKYWSPKNLIVCGKRDEKWMKTMNTKPKWGDTPMILYVTLIKSTQNTHNMISSQYPDKHAITKVFICKDLESFALKVKPRIYQ